MPRAGRLDPDAVEIPEPQIYEAEVLDDAASRHDQVRCVVPSFSGDHASDPMQWAPVTDATGAFFPKARDRAIVGIPDGGPAVILVWFPASGAEPDEPS